MKVLFAVNSESISDAIIKKYQKEYKEILSYKNVYYFDAILNEIKKDKTYDRIVISEDLEPFSNNNYDAMDKFIFEKLDSISDEAQDSDGNETIIILICRDRRTQGSSILVKLFGIGIYNALLGNDRSMEEVCRLINRPRIKKEAKLYYKIDSDDVSYDPNNGKEVSELEIQNILSYFKKLGRNTAKYSEGFNNIASQYTDEQLKIIVNCLPINVKAVLEEECQKYQELMSVNGTIQRVQQVPGKKVEKKKPGIKIDMIENKSQTKINGPIVIPSSIKKDKTKVASSKSSLTGNENKKIVKTIPKNNTEVTNNLKDEKKKSKLNDTEFNLNKKELVDRKYDNLLENDLLEHKTVKSSVENNIESNETLLKKGRGRPKKIKTADEENKPKGKRGRPKKIEDNILPGMDDDEHNNVLSPEMFTNNSKNSFDDEDVLLPGFDDDEENEEVSLPGLYDDEKDEEVALPGFDDDEEDDEISLPGFDNDEEDEEVTLPGFDDDEEDEEVTLPGFDDDEEDDEVALPGFDDDEEDEEVALPGFDDDEEEDEAILPGFDDDEEGDEVSLSGFGDDEENNENQSYSNNYYSSNNDTTVESIKSKVDYSMSNLNSLLTKDKKIVTFIGTTKNGTSFLINTLAELFSSLGINTAVLDMTKNKNSYYIYTKNEEELRNIAYNSIEKLKNGYAEGIKVDKNLTVYTSLPNDGKEYSNAEPILSTLVQNHSIVLIDCDFETNPSYFACCQEIYLVQSMDVLTIQPLTAFLRTLKTQGVLESEKVRVVINKEIRVRGLTSKTIIGGMSFYNDPAMSFMTELFNKDEVKACSIPFDANVYSNYLEAMASCNLSLKGYSKSFLDKLRILGDMVYPLTSKQTYGKTNQNYNKNAFSSSINNTLNQMKNKY